MATTTTNYGWDIPQSTDLVKDGATAIATLGQDIDTAFVDLKGGTTGQVLSKNSNTDLDFTWVAQDDSNAIQNAIVDAKGDLIAATAADTPARLAVGTDGYILTADSTAATGIKWAAAPSGSFSGCRAYTNAVTNVTSGGNTNFNLQAEEFDTDGYHSTTTNTSRMTIPTGKGGKFLLTAQMFWTSGSGTVDGYLRKNGSGFRRYDFTGSATFSYPVVDTMILAEGDYIYFEFYQNSGSTRTLDSNSSFSLVYLGA